MSLVTVTNAISCSLFNPLLSNSVSLESRVSLCVAKTFVPQQIRASTSKHSFFTEFPKKPSSSRFSSKTISVITFVTAEECPGTDRTVKEGDMVSVHFRCKTEGGVLLETSEDKEPLSFEVGAGDVMGNPLFIEFDKAVRGQKIGDVKMIKSRAAERKEELVFDVPREHEEIVRLEKESQETDGGPLRIGSVVVLSNGSIAVVSNVGDDVVTVDANHPLAGTEIHFEIEVVAIEDLAV